MPRVEQIAGIYLVAVSCSTWAGFLGLPLIVWNLNLVQIYDTPPCIFRRSPQNTICSFCLNKDTFFQVTSAYVIADTHTHTQTHIFFVVSGYNYQIRPHFSNTISPQMPKLPVEMLGFQQFPNIQFREAWFRTGAPLLHYNRHSKAARTRTSERGELNNGL